MEKRSSNYCSCLYYSANAFSRIMTKMAEDAFAPTGMTPSYAFLLMTANADPGIQPKDISFQMQLTPSTVTRLIEKMEYKGFLERRASGRATKVYPTKKSLDMDKALKNAWENLYANYTKCLGEEYANTLTAKIYDAVLILDT